MGSYEIVWKRSARKELRRLPRDVVRRVVSAVEDLQTEPLPSGVRKLRNAEHSYRIRIGSYRVVYSVLSSVLVIEIVRVAHRKDAYR